MKPEAFGAFPDDEDPESGDIETAPPRAHLTFAAIPFLTVEREKELWSRRHDPAAKAEILTAHMPLCRKLARDAFLMSKGASLSVEDFESEALLEMTVSYDKYEPDNQWGARFCTCGA